MYKCMYIQTCVCMYVIPTYVYIRMNVRMNLCMYVCMYACMCVCVCVSIHTHMSIYTCIYMYGYLRRGCWRRIREALRTRALCAVVQQCVSIGTHVPVKQVN